MALINPGSSPPAVLELEKNSIGSTKTSKLVLHDVILRVCLFATTLTSLVALVTSKQTEMILVPFPPYGASVSAKFTDSPAFVYSSVALSVTCLYSIITTILSFLALVLPKISHGFNLRHLTKGFGFSLLRGIRHEHLSDTYSGEFTGSVGFTLLISTGGLSTQPSETYFYQLVQATSFRSLATNLQLCPITKDAFYEYSSEILSIVLYQISLTTALIKRSPTLTKVLSCVFAIDVLLLGILASATGAAGEVAYLGLKGNSNVGWHKICNIYDSYCRHVGFSVLISIFASIVLSLLIILYIITISRR